MDWKELLAKAEAILAEIDELRKSIEGKTADESEAVVTEIEAKQAEYDGVFAKIEDAKAQAERRSNLATMQQALTVASPAVDIAGRTDVVPAPTGGAALPRDHAAEAQARTVIFFKFLSGGRPALSGQESELVRPTSDRFKEGKDGIVVPDAIAARIAGPNYARMFGKAIPMISSDADRSALIPQEYIAELLRMRVEDPHVLDRAQIVPTTTGTITWPKLIQTDADEYGSVSGQWISEAEEKPATEAKFEQQIITAYEYAAYTELSHSLISRSAIGMEALIGDLFRKKVMDAMDTAFLTGNGNGKPTGILNTTGIREVARQTVGTVAYQDLVELEFALRSYHRSGAMYLCSDPALKTFKGTLDTTGRPLFTPSVAGSLPDRLNGYTYLGTHRLPQLGSEGDIVFVDLSEYIIPMEAEIVVKTSDDYKFQNNVRAFVVFVIVGGELVQPRAASELKDVTS
jgi:HK97 family phage major capsid protein